MFAAFSRYAYICIIGKRKSRFFKINYSPNAA